MAVWGLSGMNSGSAATLSHLLREIVTALVDDEQHIHIRTTTEEDRIIIHVEVSPNDTGKGYR